MTQILHDTNHVPANHDPSRIARYPRQRSVLLDRQPETVIVIMTDDVTLPDGTISKPSIKVTSISDNHNASTYYDIDLARQVIAEYDRWQAELSSQV